MAVMAIDFRINLSQARSQIMGASILELELEINPEAMVTESG
jgi:hypothetical protein